tara:strand:- start:584 stop:697 length:114 start_codon:yes stop_codon:yes gene_type:complete
MMDINKSLFLTTVEKKDIFLIAAETAAESFGFDLVEV